MRTMNKFIVDGKVAVIYSPEFGAGWYTWNEEVPELLFDPAMVQLIESGQYDELATYVTLKYPKVYTGGLTSLQVKWIPEGTSFRVVEYDGNESVEVKEELDWIVA